MNVNYYYDNSDEKILSNDPEGNLVQLCRNCAEENAEIVEKASRGDEQSICELCEVCNDEEWQKEQMSDQELRRYYQRIGDFRSAEAMRRLIERAA